MFVRSETDKRRVLIIDFMHLAYRYAYGGATNLTSTIMVDGAPQIVNTTIPAYTIKQIHRWSLGGYNPTVVCFDGMGSTRSRTAYFIQNKLKEGATGYKEGREKQSSGFYDGVNITMNLLHNGGVCCLKGDGYEADDLIKAAVDKAKVDYPDLPIDVITGDVDLVPLCDDQVSVFLVSRKLTWAESKDIEKLHYYQITPQSYQGYLESLTEFKGLPVPYNTVLLKKMLRGDKSDNVPGYPKFTPTKYRNLLETMSEFGVDFEDLFVYDCPTATICYRGTEEPIPADKIESTPREMKMIKYGEPPALTRICEVMKDFVDEDIIRHMKVVYNGININGAYTGLPEGLNRRPATLTTPIKGYVASELQKVVATVQIRLPIF